ncbi:MAG: SulP family inorganic anion transporter [Chlamydiia bacterium]|nr:SulP family inorganic anion transporter [Chlamydiia bacterium]
MKAISWFPSWCGELRGYKFNFFRDDLFAAIAVSLMTIPQSIAYSLLAGLPPMAGIFSAIFGTIFTAGFGSSRSLISGPSTGTAILIQTSIADILHTYYEHVPAVEQSGLVLSILMQIVLVMGVLQIAAAMCNVSKLLQFVSRPVILGYFGGITVAIAVSQLFAFTGIPNKANDDPILYKAADWFFHMHLVSWPTLLVGGVSLLLYLFLRHKYKSLPQALIMIIVAAVLSYWLNIWLGEGSVATLRDLQLPQEPWPQFTLPVFSLKLLNQAFPAALAISLLSILEVFSISRSFAAKTGQEVHVNQDIFGVGLANFFLAFISGAMPSSGSVTRTTLNVRLQAKSRLAAILSGILTGVILFFCWPFVRDIPFAAVAALLIATVHTLMDWKDIKLSFRATRSDALVFILTFVACLIFSLDMAFFIGIVMSIGTYLKRSSTPHLVEYAFNSKGRLMVVTPTEDVHRKVRIIGIGGELYFAAADVIQSALLTIAKDPNVQALVLRLNNVYHMDASMCLAILRLHDTLKNSGRYLVISGLTEEVWHVFHRTGLVKEIGLDNLYFTDESNPQFSTWKACLRAQEIIHKHAFSTSI